MGITTIANPINTLSKISDSSGNAIDSSSGGVAITVNSITPVVGQQVMASSLPVVIASDQSAVPVSQSGTWSVNSDTTVTGQSAQTATVNNILTTSSGSAATDLINIKSATVQVISTGTGGTFIFEGSNDNSNFQTIPVYSQLIATGTPITAAITATSSNLIYTFPVQSRYVRLRIASTITGGNIQAFSRYSHETWTPAFFQVAQATAANLNVTIPNNSSVNVNQVAGNGVSTGTGASGGGTQRVVTATDSATNFALPTSVTDVASAAITTTATTASITPDYGNTYQVYIPVTAVSGTTPTMDVQIQESKDAGTNWYAVYDFARITATGAYASPVLSLTGNRVRYVQTIAGTTPSFTRSVRRLESNILVTSTVRQMVDRTINLNSTNSTTATLNADSGATNIQLVLNIGTESVATVVQIQGSDDNGTNWYNVGSTLTTTTASTTYLSTVANVSAQQYRLQVATGGTSVVLGYALLKSF